MSVPLLRYGDRAWLIDGVADPVALADQLRRAFDPDTEIVPGARTVLVRSRVGPLDRASVARAIAAAAEPSRPVERSVPVVTLRVEYDGADLAAVAEQTGLDPDAVVALHVGATYRVAFLGFAPGFGYLTGLPQQLQVPRRDVPRVSVPAGAVAIADRYSAVYPRPSPGGWHLLGTCREWLFDAARRPPARLMPGALVRFEVA